MPEGPHRIHVLSRALEKRLDKIHSGVKVEMFPDPVAGLEHDLVCRRPLDQTRHKQSVLDVIQELIVPAERALTFPRSATAARGSVDAHNCGPCRWRCTPHTLARNHVSGIMVYLCLVDHLDLCDLILSDNACADTPDSSPMCSYQSSAEVDFTGDHRDVYQGRAAQSSLRPEKQPQTSQ